MPLKFRTDGKYGFQPFGPPFPLYDPHPYGMWCKNAHNLYHLYDHTQFRIYKNMVKNNVKKEYTTYDLVKNHVAYCGACIPDTSKVTSIGAGFLSKKGGVCPFCRDEMVRRMKASGEWQKMKESWATMKVENKAKCATEEQKLLDTGEKPWYDI